MNSFKTDTLCSQFLQKYSELHGISVSFVQNMFHHRCFDFSSGYSPTRPQLEWNPSGQGDILHFLKTSGILDQLIEHGYSMLYLQHR